MAILKVLLMISSFCGLLSAMTDFPNLDKLNTKVSPKIQSEAVRGLINRTIGSRSSEFIVVINSTLGHVGKDTFQVRSQGNQIKITGTTGVAVSMGFYYYLKYHCKAQKTWAGQQMYLPSVLPVITQPVTITTNDRYRYYQNVCTLSYAMAFWKWTRWEQEIDWMALRGINLPLAFIGQEAIFQRVYLNLGFNQSDLETHFGGPAFLAWARMGNIHGLGGPLPQTWIAQKMVLQHQILKRMRSLGMTPVLPGFAGHVPAAITRVFPHANVSRLSLWYFNATYSGNYLLDFQDPLFKKIGNAFIQELINEYGTDHIYNADSFNDMRPQSSDLSYFTAAGKGVFNGMITADPHAVWVMQGWLFHNSEVWQPPQVKALVTSVPQGRLIILVLNAENKPFYDIFESFYGQPFIWCMLHNFGGTMELYGSLDRVSKGPFVGRAFPNSTMIGIGMTPEGLHQNEIMYEFMSEHAWRSKVWDIGPWMIEFATQRYGMSDPLISHASHYLQNTVYNCEDLHSDKDRVLITRRPSTTPKYGTKLWYNATEFFIVWDQYIKACDKYEGSELFAYDLVDITRNSLQLVAMQYYMLIVDGYNNRNVTAIKNGGDKLADLLQDMENLLASNDRFLLGKWIADARSWGTDTSETDLYEYNARVQITLWGPKGEIVDYASKQWAGIMKDYYKPRFAFFTNWLQQLIRNGTSWNSTIFNEKIMATVEIPWTKAKYSYPIKPSGNAMEIAKALHTKYRPDTNSSFFSYLEANVMLLVLMNTIMIVASPVLCTTSLRA